MKRLEPQFSIASIMHYIISFVGIFWALSVPLYAQDIPSVESNSDSITRIILDEPSDRVRLYKENGLQYQELVGNVRLRHDSTFMRCDSAVLDENNQVQAYGHVVIQELDSTYIFADTLLYDGNTKLAQLVGDVILESGDQKLYSDRLFYQLDTRIANYYQKSYMTDGGTQLSSSRGRFDVNANLIRFLDSVLVVNDTFLLKADSMGFHTTDYRVDFLSPTVLYNDTSRLYAEAGYYLMKQEEALFYRNAQFISGETLGKGDSILYFGQQQKYELIGSAYIKKEDKVARAHRILYDEVLGELNLFQNASVKGDDIDAEGEVLIYSTVTNQVNAIGRSTVKRPEFSLTSDLLTYSDQQKTGMARGKVIWEDSSGMKRIFTDSLIYADSSQYAKAIGLAQRPLFQWMNDAGDTMNMISDTLITSEDYVVRNLEDSATIDTFQNFRAYYDVSIVRAGMQGRADSIAYNEQDSIIVLYGNPILWMDTTQLYGDTIRIIIDNGDIDRVLINGNAFVISSPDSIYFNQIKGREITATFIDGKLDQTVVEGNAESIYFILDDEGAYIGMNNLVCSRIEMTFEENNVVGIAFLKQSNGELYEMEAVTDDNAYLKGYANKDAQRPKTIKQERQWPNTTSINPSVIQTMEME